MSIDYAYLHDEEKRATDYATGGQKGVKLTQVGALDPVALIELGRVAGMGANKYSAFNYLQGFDWAHAYNAMQRHANLFWSGEDRDAESGLPHIAHAAWMALALLSFYLRGIGTDSRPPRLVPLWNEGDPIPHQHSGSTDACFCEPEEDDRPCCARPGATPHDGPCHWCPDHAFVVTSEDALTPEEARDWLNEFFGGDIGWQTPVFKTEEWGTGDGPIYDGDRVY